MSAIAKAFMFIFVMLAVAALGHDIYVWQNNPGYPFNFAAIGWMTKTYFEAEHQMVVDTLSPETFNMILTPILKIPAFFFAAGIAIFIFAIDFANRKLKSSDPGRGKDRDARLKKFR